MERPSNMERVFYPKRNVFATIGCAHKQQYAFSIIKHAGGELLSTLRLRVTPAGFKPATFRTGI